MRFSLIDLLIAIACIALGCFAVAGVGHLLGYEQLSQARTELFGVPVGVIFFLVFTPPIYRRFRLLPLFLTVCPHCKRRPPGYHVGESRWPRVVVACGNCKQTIDLWWSPPSPGDISPTTPSLLLVWPHSIGRWRLVSRGEQV
jgi:hypothetical protein